jgi:hypothetical protein
MQAGGRTDAAPRFDCRTYAYYRLGDSSNPMKRFLIGFLVGLGLMYWYLHYGDAVQTETRRWFEGSASKYRGDKHHDAATEALGEHGQRP